jgi:16S rRNA processing protein RimM
MGWTPTSTSSTTDEPGRRGSGAGDGPGPWLEVGKVSRPHGLDGEVVVVLVTNRTERMAPGSVLDASGRELRVVTARPFGDRWLVRFAGVETKRDAEGLRGTVLRAAPIDDPEAWWVHELVGSEVVDHASERHLGTVVAVVAGPVSDLLELDGGALVPLQFALRRTPGRIVVELPPGLLD